jgi:hypothetical protein
MIKRLINDWKNYADDAHILIYQMGKVGSTSLEQTIPGSIHFHTLYNNRPCYIFARQKRNTPVKKIKGKLYDGLRRAAIKSRKKIKIITLVRDPYARNVSSFFQDFAYWMYEYACQTTESQRTHVNEGLIHTVYNDLFTHTYALNWFDDEFKKLTGVDVYKHTFDKEAGFSIIKQGKYEILVLKLEKMKTNRQAVEQFTGLKLELKNTNTASAKWYGDIYTDFIENYKPKEAYLDKLYNSKLARHFYSDEELQALREQAIK